jgi:hypothetical protein
MVRRFHNPVANWSHKQADKVSDWLGSYSAQEKLREMVEDKVGRRAVVRELRRLAYGSNITNLCDPYGGTTGDMIQEWLLNRAEELDG